MTSATKASRSPPSNRKPGKPAAVAASMSLGRSPITKLPARRTAQCCIRSGMMRAVADVVDARALRQELGAHPVMQHVELGLGEEAARHAGLIGEEEHEI